MKFESLCDFQEAKQAAKRIFEKYRNGNTLGHTGIGAMMRDTYFNIQQGYNPTSSDVGGYTQELDANRDGKVTLDDLESIAIRYLCGGFEMSSNSTSPQKPSKRYSNVVRNSLSVAQRLFEKYQDISSGTISRNEVYHVIRETYEGLGRKDFEPSEDDIRVWMELCDTNNDGKVVFEQYQDFVVLSLEKAGVDIYEQ